MWIIKETGFDKNKIIHYGNQFLTGHLKLGIRGTLDEYTKNELVALNLPLVYDQVGDLWREPVNAFNPLYTVIIVDGTEVNLLKQESLSHEQSLNMKDASMSRKTMFNVNDKIITIESTRFVSQTDSRLVVGKYSVTTNKPALITIKTGIDGNIWDINGPHIKNAKFKSYKNGLLAIGNTNEKNYEIAVYKKVITKFIPNETNIKSSIDKLMYEYVINTNQDELYTFEQYSYIGVDENISLIEGAVNNAIKLGYDQILEEHKSTWNKKWFDSDVVIKGDSKAQLALRYSIYQLLLLSPSIYNNSSIPARGISGQTYKGAIFWDTEIFMLPFYLNTDLKSAKSIIEYRINGLKGALDKAKSYGFKGAFYAWESQEDGFDACTDYNVTDVFTGRKVRTYFKDKQIHISADIVYAINEYIKHSKDFDILKKGALEVILEVARFYLDYGQYKVLRNQFELWDVMGPDEYHERVHNNVFTNKMVKMVFNTVYDLEQLYIKHKDQYFDELVDKLNFHEEMYHIKSLKESIYIPSPNSEGVIEQFDGYFDFKDIELKTLLNKKIDPNEYLGGAGLAGDTQIIKQADVLTMLYLFKDSYSKEVMKANWDYYEPRTEHGSSLSASIYALVACIIGDPQYAYPLFMKSATVDLTGDSKQYAGGIYIGGTHPAASGGAYLTAIYGFSGLSIKNGTINLNPQLPKQIESISFKLKLINKQYEIFVSNDKQEIKEIQNEN